MGKGSAHVVAMRMCLSDARDLTDWGDICAQNPSQVLGTEAAASSQCLKDGEAGCCWNFLRTALLSETFPSKLSTFLSPPRRQAPALKKKWMFRARGLL